MTTSGSVAIIHHEHASNEHEPGYLLSILARYWEGAGVRVHHLYGTATFVPADVAILHVDLSVVPRKYADFARRYPVSLNTDALDIRKRRFSTLALDGTEPYQGPVIVKTDLNAGGKPERQLRRRMDPPAVVWARRALAGFCRSVGCWPQDRIVGASTYQVYPSPAEVPRTCFRSPSLIVEKFVPERRDGYYCHRRYYVLGDAEVNQVWLGTQPICAGDNDGVARDVPVPAELRRFRRRFRIEYGKIDYVRGPSGEIFVLDVNKTPWGACSDPDDQPWLDGLCVGLRGGIDRFVRRARCGVDAGIRRVPRMPGSVRRQRC